MAIWWTGDLPVAASCCDTVGQKGIARYLSAKLEMILHPIGKSSNEAMDIS